VKQLVNSQSNNDFNTAVKSGSGDYQDSMTAIDYQNDDPKRRVEVMNVKYGTCGRA
jgi:hypothetical protein